MSPKTNNLSVILSIIILDQIISYCKMSFQPNPAYSTVPNGQPIMVQPGYGQPMMVQQQPGYGQPMMVQQQPGYGQVIFKKVYSCPFVVVFYKSQIFF